MTRRLFIFAGYDKDGVIDDSLIYYIRALSVSGDVIFTMDNDVPESELQKIRQITIHASARRHGEYDFGSYKRGYVWAADSGILPDYDWVYLVNDSCWLLRNPEKFMLFLEAGGRKMTGATKNEIYMPHLQSYFVGIAKEIFMADWFDNFMRRIIREISKPAVVMKYEVGLSRIATRHGFDTFAWTNSLPNSLKLESSQIYIPLIKKYLVSEKKHGYMKKVRQILPLAEPSAATVIKASAKRIFGSDIPASRREILAAKIEHFLCSLNKKDYARVSLHLLGLPIYKIVRSGWETKFQFLFLKLSVRRCRAGTEFWLYCIKILTLHRRQNINTRRASAIYQRLRSPSAKGVVYTCLAGDCGDELRAHRHLNPSFDYVCFTDNADLLAHGHPVWQIRPLPFAELDNVRNSRWPKLNPHLIFPEYKKSLYVDGNIDICGPKIFNWCENVWKMSIPRHPERMCVYNEIIQCYGNGKDSEEAILKTLDFLVRAGMPDNWGLTENNIIFRRHMDAEIILLDSQWWDMILNYSRRDQLSLPYVLWKNGISFDNVYMPVLPNRNYVIRKHLAK